MKKVSIKDIARITGTSPTTVSFVLNGKAEQMRISKAVAAKIVAASRQEGYFPNHVAVSLRTGQTNILGLLVESMGGHFFATLATTVEAEAARYGYKIVYCSTENNKDRAREMVQMLSQRQIDGYLITPTLGMEKELQWLHDQGKSVVLVDSYFASLDIPYVLVDNYGGMLQGMDHITGNGYKNIAFVTVDLDLVQINDRLRGYQDGLTNHGLPVNDDLVLTLPYHSADKEKALDTIMAFIRERPQIDAIFFASNYLGILGLESITLLNLAIPADIAMICFDDHDVFRLYPTGITIVEQPIEVIARTSVQLLMHQLGKYEANKTDLPYQVQLPARLVVRKSTVKQ
jgi:LacI family transcriptional regulator